MIRGDDHPAIELRTGAAGVTEPALVGSRLKVRQVISPHHAEGGSVARTAEYFSLPESMITAVVAYYDEHREEIDPAHAQAMAEEEALASRHGAD